MQDPQHRIVESDGWRVDLGTYAERMSGGQWICYPWLRYICDIIMAELAKGGARIIINAPPRHGKSSLISQWLPIWFLDWHPDKRVILGGYSGPFATSWGRKVRDEFMNNPLTWTRVNTEAARADRWLTTAGGGMLSVGVGGSVTGFGGDLVIPDDVTKDWAEAMSPTKRQTVAEWWDATFGTRLEPNASVIGIQTRWHEEDFTGHLLEKKGRYLHINLPAISENHEDALGRATGDPLCPERFTRKDLLQIKEDYGSAVWAGLYQQRPAPAEGGIVKKDHIKRYGSLPQKPQNVTISWDMTFKKEGTSWVVGQVWWRHKQDYYLLHQERGRWSFTETQKEVIALHNYAKMRWGVHEVLVEKAANGEAILDSLKDKIGRLIGVETCGQSKPERLSAVAPLFEAGHVWFPDGRSFTDDLIYELISFPHAANDDQVDALSQALNRCRVRAVGRMVLDLDVGRKSSELLDSLSVG